ncbi:MAG: PadR family transcriptional regulator [bacterium]|nr:PadR family transcriptional regulator [bacterium]
MEILTRLEEVILMSIWRLKDDAYGVTVNKEVSQVTGKEYSMGALYFSLDQLLRKGLVSKRYGNPTPERGGRSKIFYDLTKEGKQALQTVRKLQESLWENVPKLEFRDK